MRRSKTSSPSFHRALHATAMFCATVTVLLLVSRAAGTPAPLERASYRPVDQGLATPESYNRTRRQSCCMLCFGGCVVVVNHYGGCGVRFSCVNSVHACNCACANNACRTSPPPTPPPTHPPTNPPTSPPTTLPPTNPPTTRPPTTSTPTDLPTTSTPTTPPTASIPTTAPATAGPTLGPTRSPTVSDRTMSPSPISVSATDSASTTAGTSLWVGLTVAAVVLLLLLLFGGTFWVRRRRKDQATKLFGNNPAFRPTAGVAPRQLQLVPSTGRGAGDHPAGGDPEADGYLMVGEPGRRVSAGGVRPGASAYGSLAGTYWSNDQVSANRAEAHSSPMYNKLHDPANSAAMAGGNSDGDSPAESCAYQSTEVPAGSAPATPRRKHEGSSAAAVSPSPYGGLDSAHAVYNSSPARALATAAAPSSGAEYDDPYAGDGRGQYAIPWAVSDGAGGGEGQCEAVGLDGL